MSSEEYGDRYRTLLIAEAARVMGVSRRTVYYRIREGRLMTIRTRGGSQRVVVPSLSALVEEGRHRNARPRHRSEPPGPGPSLDIEDRPTDEMSTAQIAGA